MTFKLDLGDEAIIDASGERGIVVGRAEYLNAANSYLIRYKNAHGVAVEQWWPEDALFTP